MGDLVTDWMRSIKERGKYQAWMTEVAINPTN